MPLRFHLIGRLFTSLVFLYLLLPNLVAPGMFMDGMMYATLAHNIYLGEGSFWQPYFSAEYYPIFNEHPPLIFGLHSLFYQLFGDSYIIDKLFSFLVALFTLILLHRIWLRLFDRDSTFRALSWFPILLWITIPRVFWTYQNNMLDSAMGLFCALAVWLILHVNRENQFKNWVWLFLASLALLGAFLSKGFIGLFPLCLLFWFDSLIYKLTWLRVIGRSLIFVSIFALVVVLFFAWIPDAYQNISAYLNTQVKQSLMGQRETDSRFFIIKTLLTEALLPILLTAAAFIFHSLRKQKHVETENNAQAQLLIALGLSGILPIMISPKQLGFYLIPAIPYVVMGLSVFIIQYFKLYQIKLKPTFKKYIYVKLITAMVILVVLVINQHGKPVRDADELADAEKIEHFISTTNCIASGSEMLNSWTMMAYLKRYHGVELRFKPNSCSYFLAKDELLIHGYKLVNLGLKRYKLYQKI